MTWHLAIQIIIRFDFLLYTSRCIQNPAVIVRLQMNQIRCSAAPKRLALFDYLHQILNCRNLGLCSWGALWVGPNRRTPPPAGESQSHPTNCTSNNGYVSFLTVLCMQDMFVFASDSAVSNFFYHIDCVHKISCRIFCFLLDFFSAYRNTPVQLKGTG